MNSSFTLRVAYDLVIQSEIDLPELMAVPIDRAREPVDVKIRIGVVDVDGIAGGKQLDPFLWIAPQELWLHIPEVARFLIRAGKEILIDPEPNTDEDSIRVFLLGSAFGALLFQRGFLVLHGNAVQIGNQCMVCVGDSGAGKSTLAARFVQRGHPILADDVVPVDNECRALPGFPRVKLWQDAANQLQIDTTPLRRIRPDMDKYNYPVSHCYADQALPIRWIYILNSHNQAETLLEPINGLNRFGPLYENTYRMLFLEGMNLQKEHLALCGKLAGRIHLRSVKRSGEGFNVDALVDRILADIAENP